MEVEVARGINWSTAISSYSVLPVNQQGMQEGRKDVLGNKQEARVCAVRLLDDVPDTLHRSHKRSELIGVQVSQPWHRSRRAHQHIFIAGPA